MNLYLDFKNSYIYFSVGVVLILWALFRKNDNFFDIRHILINHFKLFRNSPSNYIIFYGVPILLSIGTTINKTVDIQILTNLNVIVSIFISALCASLAVIGIYNKNTDIQYRILRDETFNCILFEVILCIFLLIFSFCLICSDIFILKDGIALHSCSESTKLYKILSGILYFITYTVFMQIFIVIKKISYLHKCDKSNNS